MFDPQSETLVEAREHLKTLSEDEFEQHYKATKRQYKAVAKSIEWLQEVIEALEEPGPMEMDTDLIEDTRVTFDDLMRLLERMHMVAYWKAEERDEY